MLTYTKIYDISRPLYPGMVVYPGNPEFKSEKRESPTGTSVHSKLELGTHTGAHLDAPYHVFQTGETIDEHSLSSYVGECRVLDATSCTESVSKDFLEKQNIQKGERILLKTTNSARGYETFFNDFVYLSGDGVEYLAECEVELVGIDALSIKQRGSKDERPHTALLSKNIPILEGIDLSKVPEGTYTLIALPLFLKGLDGSPVRAILVS